MTKKAVCALIIKDDKILSVSRKNDPNAFGLIGGAQEKDETPEQAIIREVLEETGLTFSDVKPIYTAMCGEYETTTFVGKYSREIFTREAGIVKWCSVKELLNGPFAEYNKKLFDYI